MPICSYTIYPEDGKFAQLREKLDAISQVDTHTDEAQQLIIVVTETKTHSEEHQLQNQIKEIPEVQCLTLSYAYHADEEIRGV